MNQKSNMNVAVLGASNKSERYSYMAVNMLKEHGYNVIPVHPSGKKVCGIETFKSLDDIPVKIHTLSVYLNPALSSEVSDSILRLKPERIIFNPGTENSELEKLCLSNGIEVLRACTLVLLRTSAF